MALAPATQDEDGLLTPFGWSVAESYAQVWADRAERNLMIERSYPELADVFYAIRSDSEFAARFQMGEWDLLKSLWQKGLKSASEAQTVIVDDMSDPGPPITKADLQKWYALHVTPEVFEKIQAMAKSGPVMASVDGPVMKSAIKGHKAVFLNDEVLSGGYLPGKVQAKFTISHASLGRSAEQGKVEFVRK